MKSWLICIGVLLLTCGDVKSQSGVKEISVLHSLTIKLESLYDRDEHYRLILDSVQRKFHMGSKEYNGIFALMQASDSINQKELIPILDKYGWLGKSDVGEKANDAIFYVLHHANQEIRIKYVPLMKASVARGESNAKHLEWLEDRIAHYQGKPQKSGSQSYAVQRKDGTFDYYEDISIANVERRKEGLDTIAVNK